MAWVPLNLDAIAPKELRDFVRGHLEMLLHDVHAMMRLPIRRPASASGGGIEFEEGLGAGCNFAAANWLLTIVSGVSTLVYPGMASGKRFKELLRKYYPWEPTATPEPDIDDLYEAFRNPLAHALGIPTEDLRPGVRRTAMTRSLGVGKSGLPEDLIERLERSTVRTAEAPVTISRNSEGGITLSVEGLYWGVRIMIERVVADPVAAAAVVGFLK